MNVDKLGNSKNGDRPARSGKLKKLKRYHAFLGIHFWPLQSKIIKEHQRPSNFFDGLLSTFFYHYFWNMKIYSSIFLVKFKARTNKLKKSHEVKMKLFLNFMNSDLWKKKKLIHFSAISSYFFYRSSSFFIRLFLPLFFFFKTFFLSFHFFLSLCDCLFDTNLLSVYLLFLEFFKKSTALVNFFWQIWTFKKP